MVKPNKVRVKFVGANHWCEEPRDVNVLDEHEVKGRDTPSAVQLS